MILHAKYVISLQQYCLLSQTKHFMWILWLMILTETLNEETHGVITCMILHVKYVISLQQFCLLSQIKHFMWMLWFINLTEKLHEQTCEVITYMILHIITISENHHLPKLKLNGLITTIVYLPKPKLNGLIIQTVHVKFVKS